MSTMPPYGYPPQEPPAAPHGPGQPGDPGRPGVAGHPPPAPPEPGADLGTDLKESLSWAWQAFSRHLAVFLVPGIVYTALVVALIVVGVVIAMAVMFSMLFSGGPPYPEDPPLLPLVLMYVIVLATIPIAMIPGLLWQSGAARATRAIMDGGRPSIGEGFIGSGPIILTALLYTAMVTVGSLLLYLPGLAAAFFGFFAVAAAAAGARPLQAIKESFALVRDNLATVLVVYLVVSAVGSMLVSLVVGMVVVVPAGVLVQFALYERLNGRELSEPSRA